MDTPVAPAVLPGGAVPLALAVGYGMNIFLLLKNNKNSGRQSASEEPSGWAPRR